MTVPVATGEWTRDYTAFMRCDAGDGWLPQVESQVAAWLREKNIDLDTSADSDIGEDTWRASVRRLSNGKEHDLRLTLVEDTALGTWSTELIAHDEPGSQDWISLKVSNDSRRFVKVPRLARYLMQVLPLRDSSIEFIDHPHAFHDVDVDSLVHILSDADRHGLVFVAGTDQRIPLDSFTSAVTKWTNQVYGLAQIIILDPSATQRFSDRVGPPAAAHPWTIRTYLPGVDFADPTDARRHRFLSTERLATRPSDAITALLGEIARNQASTRAYPAEVSRLRRRFERVENRKLVEALTSVPQPDVPSPAAPVVETAPETISAVAPPATTSPDDIGLLERIRTIFGLGHLSEAALDEIAARLRLPAVDPEQIARFEGRVSGLQDQLEELQDQTAQLQEALADAQLEQEVVRLDLDNRNARIRWLENRLKDVGDYEAAWTTTPDDFQLDRPGNFGDLLDRCAQLQGIEFCGDPTFPLRLDSVDTNGAALRAAWDAVLAMSDYVRARASGDWVKGLDMYLQGPPDMSYRTVKPGGFAETETRVTMNSWGNERMFPVPKSVDSSGWTLMKAHFKLARIGMTSPRMYVLDGHPKKPVVYIGYIGPHLTNTQTN